MIKKVETIVIIKRDRDIRGSKVHISRCKEINSVREDGEQPQSPQRWRSQNSPTTQRNANQVKAV